MIAFQCRILLSISRRQISARWVSLPPMLTSRAASGSGFIPRWTEYTYDSAEKTRYSSPNRREEGLNVSRNLVGAYFCDAMSRF